LEIPSFHCKCTRNMIFETFQWLKCVMKSDVSDTFSLDSVIAFLRVMISLLAVYTHTVYSNSLNRHVLKHVVGVYPSP